MNMGNMVISVTYSNAYVDNIGSYFMVIFGFFGLFALLLVHSVLVTINRKNEDIWIMEKVTVIEKETTKSVFKVIMKIVSIFILMISFLVGIIAAVVLLFGKYLSTFSFIGVAVPQFGIAWSVFICGITLVLFRFIKNKRSITSYLILILGIFSILVTLIPSFSIPFMIRNAQSSFDASFNPIFDGDWESQIPSEVESYFLKFPYYGTQYYLGQKPKNCTVLEHVLYFNGSLSSFEVDHEILLYFDAYLPPVSTGLPGENSILIRIHGGGWSFGDKGLTNMMQMNKYFAAQGYVVFDIQYGMYDTLGPNVFTPEYVLGDFTLDDIVRHIGNFTHFLAANADNYGANLDSVFVSGGSAGGQLTLATALGIASSVFVPTFNSSLEIKGLIPYYPGIDYHNITDPIRDPSLLVDNTSPPCLIYQGTHDGLVRREWSELVYQRYLDSGNPNCSLIMLPFSGHANDFHFTGSYNQIFLYFMERFMYLFH
jgi:acetyl esterase/lipase